MFSINNKAFKFTERTSCIIYVIIFYTFIVSNVAGQNSKKFSILRERIRRLEGRLSEDISLIREEFYDELNTLSNEKFHTTGNESMDIETEFEMESLKIKFEELKNDLFFKIEAFSEGNRQEKRIRRDIEKEICGIKAHNADVLVSVDKMSETLTSAIKDAVDKISVTEKLTEIIDVLETISDHHSKNIKGNVEHKSDTDERVRDCADWLKRGYKTSGEYTIFPKNVWRSLRVYCDMETMGGGWTVFQRRKDGSENFNRKWIDYTFGFGNLSGEFWLGNEFIHKLTVDVPHELLIELEDFENDRRHASYGLFSVGSAEDSFKLYVDFFTGNVTDSLVSGHSGHGFSTTDRGASKSCAHSYKGGWWYAKCHKVNINGLYLKGEHKSFADGVNWLDFRGYHYSLKETEMKFRPH